jgi:hypothetical protein
MKNFLLISATVSCVFASSNELPGSDSDDDAKSVSGDSVATDGTDGDSVCGFEGLNVLLEYGIVFNRAGLNFSSRENVFTSIPESTYHPFSKVPEDIMIARLNQAIISNDNIPSQEYVKRFIGQLPQYISENETSPKMHKNYYLALQLLRVLNVILEEHFRRIFKGEDYFTVYQEAFRSVRVSPLGKNKPVLFVYIPVEIAQILDVYNGRVYVDRQGVHICHTDVKKDKMTLKNLFQAANQMLKTSAPGNIAKWPMTIEEERSSKVDSLVMPWNTTANVLMTDYVLPPSISLYLVPVNIGLNHQSLRGESLQQDKLNFLQLVSVVLQHALKHSPEDSFRLATEGIQFFEVGGNGVMASYVPELEKILRFYEGRIYVGESGMQILSEDDKFNSFAINSEMTPFSFFVTQQR